jgi:N-acyl-D-aspartate/D-glutamate deacylase
MTSAQLNYALYLRCAAIASLSTERSVRWKDGKPTAVAQCVELNRLLIKVVDAAGRHVRPDIIEVSVDNDVVGKLRLKLRDFIRSSKHSPDVRRISTS